LSKILILLLAISLHLFAQNNYEFGPSIRVNDDPPGSSHHNIRSSGQHGIACRGDTVYAVFADERSSGYRAVYFSKSTDGGQTWWSNVRVAGGLSDFETMYASITLNAQGVIYVAFRSDEPGNDRNVYFIKSIDGGLSFLDSVLVNDTTRAIQWRPSIAVDSSGQKVFVAWEDARNPVNPPNYDIYFARSTDGGTTFLPSIRVDDTGSDTTWQIGPSIGCTQSGDTIYVAWDDDRNGTLDVYFSRSIDGGLSFEPNILVNDTAGTTPSSQWLPSLWVNRLGNVYVCWQDQRSGLQIYCDKSTDGGISFSQDILVSDSAAPASYPSVAADDSDRVFVAWRDARDYDTTGHDIYFSFSSDGGNTYSSDVRVNDLGGIVDAWDWNANIAVNENGKVFVAWDTDRNDPQRFYLDIYCASGQYVGVQEFADPAPAISVGCHPNPFTELTIISLTITQEANSKVCMRIYDISGRLAKSFENLTWDYLSVNQVVWNGTDDTGNALPPGVYFCFMQMGEITYTYKIVRIK